MPVRNRRARLVALALFLVFAFVLYSRSGSTVQDYQYYATKTYNAAIHGGGDGVGGGAVLREKPGDEPDQDEAGHAAGPQTEGAVPERTIIHDVVEVTGNDKAAAETTKSAVSPSTSTSAVTSVPTLDSITGSMLDESQQGLPAITYDDDVLPIEAGQGRVEVNPLPTTASQIHWTKSPEHFPISSTIQLPTGSPSPIPKVQHTFKSIKDRGADKDRLIAIKAAAIHAWYGYREKAWGQDEIRPVSGTFNNPFNAWGATLVDALDTLWIMDMRAEFDEAVKYVETIDFTTSPRADIPLFETTIRYLGGLVAAYDISGKTYPILLHKAVELAEVLYSAFDTPNRMPEMYYHWKPAFSSQPHRSSTRAVLAELGSLSMEFTRLAQLTGEPKYYDAVARITDAFDEWQDDTRLPGMWPTYVDASGCTKNAVLPAGSVVGPGPHMAAPYGQGEMKADDPVQVTSFQAPDFEKQPEMKKAAKEAVEKQNAESQRKLAEEEGGIVGRIDGFDDSMGKQELERATKVADNKAPPKVGGIVDRVRVEDDTVPEGLQKRQLDGVTTGSKGPPQQPSDSCVPQGLVSPNKHGIESFTLAGMSDSTYEYLPKMHLLLGARTSQYENMYVKSAKTAIEKLIYRPMTNDSRDILVAGDLSVSPNATSTTGEMIETFKAVGSHLVCFAGGMFALGGVLFNRPEDVEIGKKLTDGCVWAYNVTATGIMAEDFTLSVCDDKDDCTWDEAKYWAELDPYRDARTKVHNPATVVQKLQHPETNLPAIDQPHYADSDYNERKRSLPAADHLPNLPDLPAVPTSAAAGPTLPVPDHTIPSAPVYTPPPPLSHAEYVAQKISAERLPPGFTRIASKNYILRPEAIESVFYLWRITGDEYWRERGWEMFVAVQDHTRTVWGNSAIDDVTKEAPEPKDSEESFWLAETLKYFYLLFDEPNRFSLEDWVLNTEAHFFKRPDAE